MLFFFSKNVSLPGTVGNWPWLGTKATAVCFLKDIYTAVCLVKFNFSSNTLDRVPVPVIPIQGRTLLLCKTGARSRALKPKIFTFFNCMSLQSGAPLGEKYV